MTLQIPPPMQSKEPAEPTRIESRWPGVLAVFAVLLLMGVLPGRISLFPAWMAYALGLVVLLPMMASALAGGRGWREPLERRITVLFFVIVVAANIANLTSLARTMAHHANDVSGLQLLASSVWVWVTNVLAFSLLYWQLDRGGPGARENLKKVKPDWQFPQTSCPDDVPANWQPTFVDYLFLGYSTATAFSPTDALPLSSRAKLLMMLESTISLVTIVVVASRAINILGG